MSRARPCAGAQCHQAPDGSVGMATKHWHHWGGAALKATFVDPREPQKVAVQICRILLGSNYQPGQLPLGIEWFSLG